MSRYRRIDDKGFSHPISPSRRKAGNPNPSDAELRRKGLQRWSVAKYALKGWTSGCPHEAARQAELDYERRNARIPLGKQFMPGDRETVRKQILRGAAASAARSTKVKLT